MFKNYLTTALRNIFRNKLYSVINIGGLAIGLAACVLILSFIRYELSYDEWIADADRIEKLELHIPIPGRDPLNIAQVPPGLVPLLADHFKGEIEAATRFEYIDTVARSADNQFNERVNLVDGNFFDVIDVPMLSGDRSALTTSNSAVLISESTAHKYFGDTAAEGQTISIDLYGTIIDYSVAGVFRDIPKNSHMAFNFLVLLDTKREGWGRYDEGFGGAFLQAAYAKFAPGADPRSVEARFTDFYLGVAPARGDGSGTYDYRTARKFNFINVRDVHLYSDKIQQIKPIGDIQIVINFAVVAGLILVIATINFTNLATAQAIRRAKEVSVRKVMGAKRGQLMGQFLGESVLTTLLALLIALPIVELFLPAFRTYLDADIQFSLLNQPLQNLAVTGLALLIGLLGGAYPSLYLSKFRPATLLGDAPGSAKGSMGIRQALVVFQFAISIALIIATTVVYNQMQLMQTMDLGFDKNHKLAIQGLNNSQVAPQEATIRQEILKVPGVNNATLTTDQLPLVFYNDIGIAVPGLNTDEEVDTDRIFVDAHFFDVFDVKPMAGRLYGEEYQSDTLVIPEDKSLPWTRSAVVTETFIRKAGFKTADAAIGEMLLVNNYGTDGQALHATIVGVVPDMHVRSLRERTGPLVFFASSQTLNIMVLDIKSDDLARTLAEIDEAWARVVPDMPINRAFIGEGYDALYDNERRLGEVFALFAVFAIFVACLGLFGLAAFSAEQRTKEVGIRKVLGANIPDILKLLSWQFVRPVLWANLIAWPIAWYVMENWLQSFTYRVDLDWLLFFGAGSSALIIAWLTVGTQAYRVARTNPVHALRYE